MKFTKCSNILQEKKRKTSHQGPLTKYERYLNPAPHKRKLILQQNDFDSEFYPNSLRNIYFGKPWLLYLNSTTSLF